MPTAAPRARQVGPVLPVQLPQPAGRPPPATCGPGALRSAGCSRQPAVSWEILPARRTAAAAAAVAPGRRSRPRLGLRRGDRRQGAGHPSHHPRGEHMTRIGVDAHVLDGKYQGTRTWILEILRRAPLLAPDLTFVVYSADADHVAGMLGAGVPFEHRVLPEGGPLGRNLRFWPGGDPAGRPRPAGDAVLQPAARRPPPARGGARRPVRDAPGVLRVEDPLAQQAAGRLVGPPRGRRGHRVRVQPPGDLPGLRPSARAHLGDPQRRRRHGGARAGHAAAAGPGGHPLRPHGGPPRTAQEPAHPARRLLARAGPGRPAGGGGRRRQRGPGRCSPPSPPTRARSTSPGCRRTSCGPSTGRRPCSVFPSLGEGWGIPVLEALAAGATVVASSATAIPEAGGDACTYFDPTGPDPAGELGGLLVDAFSGELPRSLTARAQVSRHSWDASAVSFVTAIRRALADLH